MNKPNVIFPVWIAVGFVLGIGMDNIGAGIAIGIATGAAFYTKKKKDEQKDSPDENDV